MQEQPPTGSNPSAVQANLREVARLLRGARHLDPEAQQELSQLLEELSVTLEEGALPSGETAHLAEVTAHLARSLHQRREPGLLVAARERLEDAVIRAEAEAPLATGIVRRFLEALANIGI